jgi:CDP-diacylglycerol---glycerol-3-phosphate 3-phosphatidyltransferase
MYQHVPNSLTILRLALAGVFFVMLSWYQYQGRGDPLLLNVAFVVYVVDPFVDKILVLGSFIFFAGKNFIIPETDHTHTAHPWVVKTISGVTPAMVVILLARELLVTSLRGHAEAGGQKFGAAFVGKFKMAFQSGCILVILLYVNYYRWLTDHGYGAPAMWFRNFVIWATVIITVYSSLEYLKQGRKLMTIGKEANG